MGNLITINMRTYNKINHVWSNYANILRDKGKSPDVIFFKIGFFSL